MEIDEFKKKVFVDRFEKLEKMPKGTKVSIRARDSISGLWREPRTLVLKGKGYSKAYNTYKISLMDPANPRGMGYFLYKRKNLHNDSWNVSFATGDMGTELLEFEIL